eukprot:scaffold3821_cov127-Cylindrotheca_fusiformis.AAC.5
MANQSPLALIILQGINLAHNLWVLVRSTNLGSHVAPPLTIPKLEDRLYAFTIPQKYNRSDLEATFVL